MCYIISRDPHAPKGVYCMTQSLTDTTPKPTTVTRTRTDGGSVAYDPAHESKVIGVKDRTLIGTTGAFSVKVPKNTSSGINPENNEKYTHFYHLVTGGGINFHIYGEPEKRGKKIRVFARIWEKEMNDGTKYMYVDLLPTDAEMLDCEMKSLQNAQTLPDFAKGTEVFHCRDGGKGALAFVPIDKEARRLAYEARK
jgi:hypothetical protein